MHQGENATRPPVRIQDDDKNHMHGQKKVHVCLPQTVLRGIEGVKRQTNVCIALALVMIVCSTLFLVHTFLRVHAFVHVSFVNFCC